MDRAFRASQVRDLANLSMTEFVIRLADERGRVQEQTHAAATAEELRARFTQAGYYVYSVKARGLLAGRARTRR
jgi:type IV pilus assembly protein PilC